MTNLLYIFLFAVLGCDGYKIGMHLNAIFLFFDVCMTQKTILPGAIFREREDAHIEAAVRYSVEWLSQRGIYGDIDLVIEYIDVLDHYDAIKKGFAPRSSNFF